MRASRWTARIITAVIALLLAPIAVGMVATGGAQWRFAATAANAGLELSGAIAPGLQLAIGIALLVGIVLTGIWSSAGLLAAGALGLAALLFSSVPALMMGMYRLLANSLPREWLDGLIAGVPLTILPALGGLGLALAALRRRPGPLAIGGTIGGLIGIPLALLAGGVAIAWGAGAVATQVMRFARLDVMPLVALAIVGGTLLIVAALAAVRWSPYALVLPGIILVTLNVVVLLGSPALVFGMLRPFGIEAANMLMRLLELCVPLTVGILYLAFTATALIVRRRSLRAQAA